MSKRFLLHKLGVLLSLIFLSSFLYGQVVPILNHTIGTDGRVQLTVNTTPNHYYLLQVRQEITDPFDFTTSMTVGQTGTTVLTEQLEGLPLNHYQVLEHPLATPTDIDGDGTNDWIEYQNTPIDAPLNKAAPINRQDGMIYLDSLNRFNELSVLYDNVQWSEFLNGKRFAKFIITDFHTAPKIYFINGNNHLFHADFANAIGVAGSGSTIRKGQIIYHPTTISNNGTLGTFAFNYSNGHGEDFEVVQKCQELLAANMPFVKNNLSYFVTANSEQEYSRDSLLYENSRVSLLFERDVYAAVDYWGLNEAEGFGYFREVSAGEIPGPTDVVLYNSLPNNLPRVGGIITSVIQTPLSHVNLRAIQDNVPNCFIRDPLAVDSITDLLNHYIYFKVEQGRYVIREATLQEVNDWFEELRPAEEQESPLNLYYRYVLPLEDITFHMSDGFGAKCANVATMRRLGFPEGTIPDGYGVPFYFYQEFMKANGLFERAKEMMKTPDFYTDRNKRAGLLRAFREKIEQARMPNWMANDLEEMQASFSSRTSIRCRSSTNNEDLPGFNGAGLYDSKTHHAGEGHIAKTIQEIYASLWNLRAFDERDFYRVNHFTASMAVLCHPNFSGEQANGVGVSMDPIYQTGDVFYYLNTQIGEDLITNPNARSIPEEILLDRVQTGNSAYLVIRRSSLLPDHRLVLEERYLEELREYLTIIHQEFEQLYKAQDNSTFAMEMEYKVTKEGQLVIKQARPWVGYVPDKAQVPFNSLDLAFTIYPNPAQDYINIASENSNLRHLRITNLAGQVVYEKELTNIHHSDTQISVRDFPPGVYLVSGFTSTGVNHLGGKFVKGY
ncbi:MAG: PEP/pyruvate-binding domain-containing protein [Aureispira sp.]